ncbi:MAG: hypothetical protein MZV63_72470 [Marinilabiliales bacterium]|nr:hypothetical protein [Marinilabiliales bacterium]
MVPGVLGLILMIMTIIARLHGHRPGEGDGDDGAADRHAHPSLPAHRRQAPAVRPHRPRRGDVRRGRGQVGVRRSGPGHSPPFRRVPGLQGTGVLCPSYQVNLSNT